MNSFSITTLFQRESFRQCFFVYITCMADFLIQYSLFNICQDCTDGCRGNTCVIDSVFDVLLSSSKEAFPIYNLLLF